MCHREIGRTVRRRRQRRGKVVARGRHGVPGCSRAADDVADVPLQPAMSMPGFCIDRAARQLPMARRATLNQASRKLREPCGRPA
ncbi:DUF3175 domain-containing protein [Cupriavidus sp. 2TAF22]|uniref:DUF3175 domain-containing protein n=1 Tax=unclassified Cupriavidus TaxID=2640874 RepID=UPI003F8E8DBB